MPRRAKSANADTEAPAVSPTDDTEAPEAQMSPSDGTEPAEPVKLDGDAPEPEAPAETESAEDAATCPHGQDAGCPLCALDETPEAPAPEPAQAPEPATDPEPSPFDIELLSDDEWEALAAEYREGDLPLADGEEIAGQRTEDDGDLIVVTSFGRKFGISPDGWLTVLVGAPLDSEVHGVPKPPRKSWKDPR